MHLICQSDDLKNDQCLGFENQGTRYFLVRKYNVVHCYENSCPHVGAPLEWQKNQFLDTDRELIQCAMHGALFNIEDGLCISGPCVNQALVQIGVVEKDNAIYLTDTGKA